MAGDVMAAGGELPVPGQHQAEFNKPLDRVIALCKDKGLIERAKQYREGR